MNTHGVSHAWLTQMADGACTPARPYNENQIVNRKSVNRKSVNRKSVNRKSVNRK